MRAGPLSSPRVIAKLNQEFVNVWMLAKDLAPLARSASGSEVREWAARLRDDYTYPVDSLIYRPDGEKLGNLPANEMRGGMAARVEAYLEFLQSGSQGRGEGGRR